MAELPEQVYRDAARAEVRTLLTDDQRTGWTVADADRTAAGLMQVPSFRAAVESAYRAGRSDVLAECTKRLTAMAREAQNTERWNAAGGLLVATAEIHGLWIAATSAHHEDRTYAEIADVKRGEDQ